MPLSFWEQGVAGSSPVAPTITREPEESRCSATTFALSETTRHCSFIAPDCGSAGDVRPRALAVLHLQAGCMAMAHPRGQGRRGIFAWSLRRQSPRHATGGLRSRARGPAPEPTRNQPRGQIGGALARLADSGWPLGSVLSGCGSERPALEFRNDRGSLDDPRQAQGGGEIDLVTANRRRRGGERHPGTTGELGQGGAANSNRVGERGVEPVSRAHRSAREARCEIGRQAPWPAPWSTLQDAREAGAKGPTARRPGRSSQALPRGCDGTPASHPPGRPIAPGSPQSTSPRR